jgi:hypothetical protein
MTRKQGVRRSSRAPTYTPTTSGIASNSLSCAARTALISRFGEGELVWAMFGRQPANRISAKANKAGAYNDQNLCEAALSVSITSLAYEAGCVSIFGNLFRRWPLITHHRGAEECKHLVDGICDRSRATTGKKQTHRSRSCRNVFDHQRS